MSEAEATEVSFHARVRKDYRVGIPPTERAAAGIREGDLVSVRLRKVSEPREAPP